MQTTDLIERLAGELRPTPRRVHLLAIAIVVGVRGGVRIAVGALGVPFRPC